MDDAGPQSLFVVVSYGYKSPYFSSILLFETSEGRPKMIRSSSLSSIETHLNSIETHLNQKEYVAHLSQPQGYPPTRWVFSPLASSSKDLCKDLCMVPDWDLCMVPDWGRRNEQIGAELHGCIFNLRTKKCKSIKPPGGSRFYKRVVSLGDHIYVMAGARTNYVQESFFARYNPLKDSWETLKPLPSLPSHGVIYWHGRPKGIIWATAVWGDTILLNIDGCIIWAYDVGRNKWYHVCVEDMLCYSIVGEAVVLGNSIYALTKGSYDLVVALSIEKEEINGDLVFKCSLLSDILVPGMDEFKIKDNNSWWRTRHLVHLGKDNFCFVQSRNSYLTDSYLSIVYQPIQLTYMKLKKGENSMTVTDIFVHQLKILQNEQFQVELCFSLPEHKTTALKEGTSFIFGFNPFSEGNAAKPVFQGHAISELDNDSSQTNIYTRRSLPDDSEEDYASKQKDKIDFNPEPEVVKRVYKNVTLPDEEGHSIYVRKLPHNANVRLLEMGLKKFGAIKRDRIKVGKNKKGKPYAFVEFESATSKQRAIEASTIRIGGCPAEILEKR